MIVREWLKSNHEIDKEIDALNSELQSEIEIVGSNEYVQSIKKKIRDLYKVKNKVF